LFAGARWFFLGSNGSLAHVEVSVSDEVLNIKVTETEINLIMDLLHEAGERTDANGQPAFELCHDLMEQSAALLDGWIEELEPTNITDELFELSAEAQMIQAGIDAREQVKANSRSAARRNFNLKDRDRRLSETQTHDVWDANDPKNW
jgi:hypothetical protein